MRTNLITLLTALLFVPLVALHAADATPGLGSEQPQVQANCNGVPIKRFGYCWVLGEAPNLLDDVSFQSGNTAPRVKVHPKDSSQIRRNYLGVTTTRMPRSTENDYPRQPGGMPCLQQPLARRRSRWSARATSI